MKIELWYDPEEQLREQQVAAWGGLQSIKEEPEFKEADIKSEDDKAFFEGIKWQMDDCLDMLDDAVTNGLIEESLRDHIWRLMKVNLCMHLWAILDYQDKQAELE